MYGGIALLPHSLLLKDFAVELSKTSTAFCASLSPAMSPEWRTTTRQAKNQKRKTANFIHKNPKKEKKRKQKKQNRREYQNQTAGNFECKNRNFKNDQNRKTENPNTPLLWVRHGFSSYINTVSIKCNFYLQRIVIC